MYPFERNSRLEEVPLFPGVFKEDAVFLGEEGSGAALSSERLLMGIIWRSVNVGEGVSLQAPSADHAKKGVGGCRSNAKLICSVSVM